MFKCVCIIMLSFNVQTTFMDILVDQIVSRVFEKGKYEEFYKKNVQIFCLFSRVLVHQQLCHFQYHIHLFHEEFWRNHYHPNLDSMLKRKKNCQPNFELMMNLIFLQLATSQYGVEFSTPQPRILIAIKANLFNDEIIILVKI